MNEINTEHGIFTSNEITGQTAQEVYEEWLENKDKPVEPQPSTDDKIIVLESEIASLNKKNNELLDAVEFLLKNTGFIPQEV